MAKEEKMTEEQVLKKEPATQAPAEEQPKTPNRDAYSQMWGEDNGDVDFEDKEARYARAIDDRNELRNRRKSDAILGGLFDKHAWLGMMYQELNDNPDMNPFEWLAGFCAEQGISIQEVLDNDEAQKRLTEKMTQYQERLAKSEKTKKEQENNLESSAEALTKIQNEKGLSNEECLSVWGDFWKMYEDASKGMVGEDVWRAFLNSRSYENDIKAAREEGGMQARNEKIQNQVRTAKQEQGLPPSLNQGSGAPSQPKENKKNSFLSGLSEDY